MQPALVISPYTASSVSAAATEGRSSSIQQRPQFHNKRVRQRGDEAESASRGPGACVAGMHVVLFVGVD
eukprot:1097644-Pelagomonas_calceolata.AAC.6